MVTAVDEEVVEEKAARLRVPEVLRVLKMLDGEGGAIVDAEELCGDTECIHY